MPIRHFNPHTGARLVTLNLTGVPNRSCWSVDTRQDCKLHTIKLGKYVLIGETSGIVRAYGFVGRVFQVTLEVPQ